jgi:hypothetical protein
VLGVTTRYTLAPKFKGCAFEFATHQLYHLCFTQAELLCNGLKGRAIFPRHLDDSGNVTQCIQNVGPLAQRIPHRPNWEFFRLTNLRSAGI